MQRARVQVWLFDSNSTRIEGTIVVRDIRFFFSPLPLASPFLTASSSQGFDEYMNLVMDNAAEVNLKSHAREELGAWLRFGLGKISA